MPMIPRKVFFTKGVGKHKVYLRSFELALRDAGIEKFNIVKVSSILPPGCKIVPKLAGLEELFPGQIVHAVLAQCSSNEPHRLIVASLGCAKPADKNAYGYLAEHHAYGETDGKAGDFAEDLAVEMLASTLGIEYDENKSYNENKEIYQLKDKIVRTLNITQSSICGTDEKHHTVIAAAVFVP